MSVLRKVVYLQRKYCLIPPRSRILIAFSGGVDSVVLYTALKELSHFFNLKEIALAHLNHKLREDADRDEEFCRQFARKVGVKIFTSSVDTRAFARKEGLSLEEAGRRLRYEFFHDILKKEGYDLIATGHHLNDLVETIFLWLIRGSGLEGITGFEPKEGKVIRPLFLVKKEEIRRFAIEKGLDWVEDVSNYSFEFVRNKIRHRIMPVVKEINPSVEDTLLAFRDILTEENRFMDTVSEELLKRVADEEGNIDCKLLRNEHTALQRRVIKKWLGIREFRKIEQIRKLLFKGGRVNIGGGREVISKGGKLYLKS